MSHNKLWIILLLLAIPVVSSAEVHVNDSGTWKAPAEIHVNDGGTWKAAQEVHVNDAGVWTLVFTLEAPTGLLMEFTWETTDTINITEYRIYLNNTILCTVANPADVTIECAGPDVLPQPSKISMTAMAIEIGETFPSNVIWAAGYPGWQASTAYALGAKVQAGDGWSYSAPMVAITVGTSGATEPTWPVRKSVAGVVVDNGNDTVNIPSIAHGFVSGSEITVTGTTNYDGIYTLGIQASQDNITVMAPYVAEDASGSAVAKKVTDGSVVWELTYE